jgi:DNA-binding GntR family transcriptional regulator
MRDRGLSVPVGPRESREKVSGMLREDAYARLKQSLFGSAVRPGQLVSQRELAALIRCPLGPTREAIQRLAAEGLLRVVPQRGIVINNISLDFIREVFGLRALIEREAVRTFFEKADRREATQLKAAHRTLLGRARTRIDKPLLTEALHLDWRFHDLIVAALDNGLIEEIYRVNSDRIRLIQAKRGYVADRLCSAMQEHIDILDAGLRQGPAAAAAAMDRHLSESRRWAVLV